jgi:hypothetical protein
MFRIANCFAHGFDCFAHTLPFFVLSSNLTA